MMMKPATQRTWLHALVAVVAALALVTATARAQDDDSDSTWDDLGLNPEGFKLDEDIFGHASAGWFPQPYSALTLNVSGPFLYQDTWDRAPGIRPRAFKATTEPFSAANPFTGDERKILQPNSADEEDDGYPTTSFSDYSLNFFYNPPIPLILRVNGGLQISEGMLFSEDDSRSYLTIGGAKQQFKEVGVAYLKQYSIAGTGGVVIPIYGAFIKNESATISSYYYLYGGYSLAYAVSSKGTQYTQIANAKDEIRYGNGADTVTLIEKSTFEGLNRLRQSIELGIGWNLTAEGASFGFEAFVSLPRTSVLNDVDWKQYFAGFRISIGYQWFPWEKEKKSP